MKHFTHRENTVNLVLLAVLTLVSILAMDLSPFATTFINYAWKHLEMWKTMDFNF